MLGNLSNTIHQRARISRKSKAVVGFVGSQDIGHNIVMIFLSNKMFKLVFEFDTYKSFIYLKRRISIYKTFKVWGCLEKVEVLLPKRTKLGPKIVDLCNH